MTLSPIMITMGVGRGIVFPNDSVWRLQPPATNPRGMVELWSGNSGSTTPPAIMRTGVYATASDGTVWEYAPPTLTKISTVLVSTTWNPSDQSGATLSNGNLTATGNGGAVRAIAGNNAGRYYFEYTVGAMNGGNSAFGLATSGASLSAGASNPGQVVTTQSGEIWSNSTDTALSIGFIASAGTIVGVAVDLNAHLIWFRVNSINHWNGNFLYDPATGVGGVNISSLTGNLYPFLTFNWPGDNSTANFGASTFNGLVPSGFTAGWGTLQ